MSASYDDRYEREPMGLRLSLKLDRLSEWHALDVHCTHCAHQGYITAKTLRQYYGRHMKISDMEHRFRCRGCRARGCVRWAVVKQRR